MPTLLYNYSSYINVCVVIGLQGNNSTAIHGIKNVKNL